ncbi:MAG: chromate transporter [Clostridia bacterium]|nr:chromate transporter [Clostridia bacterium]
MLYLELIWSFFKIGITSFGGTSMIPLINSEMISHGWMAAAEVSDIVAIAEMTPGPLALNCATFAGIRTAGVLGAICANFGILIPTFTLTFLAAIFIEKFRTSTLLEKLLTGIRPATLGLVAGVMVTLSMSSYVVHDAISIPALLIGALDVVLLMKFKLSIPKVILISGVLGIICFKLLGL